MLPASACRNNAIHTGSTAGHAASINALPPSIPSAPAIGTRLECIASTSIPPGNCVTSDDTVPMLSATPTLV